MKNRILVSDRLHEKGIEVFSNRPGFQVDVITGLTPSELKEIIGKYDGLVIRSDTRVTADILSSAHKLRIIGRAGTGLDNVDVVDATRRGIVVMNTPGGNSEAAAEFTIALIMATHRHIPQAVASMKDGKWEKKKYQGREISGKTLGIIGLGKIGSLVGRRASKGLKMNVLGYDPAMTPEAATQLGVKPASLNDIFARSDVITLHTPLNEDTVGLINAESLKNMKRGVIIINCARGGIVDETALLEALDLGTVAAAALDDFTVKPPGLSPLVSHPRVICTPHLGASTGEAQISVAVLITSQMVEYLEAGIIKNAVNVPTLDPGENARQIPYMDLCRRLGQFAGKLAASGVKEMEVQYRGEIASWDLKPMTNSALVGLLSRFEGMEVNHVNASLVAQDRGIRVMETTMKETSGQGPSVVVRVKGLDASELNVCGALIRRVEQEPRIIGIDQFVTEAVPAGPMLIVANRDVPGVVAGVSGALAKKGINIAQMNLSRDRQGGMALSIINVDAPADKDTLQSIGVIEGILSVRQITLDP